MSRSCRVRIKPNTLPAAASLQGELKALGYKLDLEGLDLARASGFQGCVLDGEDAGFSVARDDDALTLRWSGDEREHCAALMVAAALQRLSEAEVSVGAGAPIAPDALQALIGEVLEAM